MERWATELKTDEDDRNKFYLIAAELVIAECLRIPPNHPDSDPFFGPDQVGENERWFYSARVVSIADTLFMLRNATGFDVFCERLRMRDVRSAFSELFAARMIFDLGYAIEARREVGIRGEDFDFAGRLDGQLLCVEVTTLKSGPFAPNALLNALSAKRSQLRTDAPGIIFVVVPEYWFEQIPGLDETLRKEVIRFFESGTLRVNAVILINEVHQHFDDEGSAGHLSFQFAPVINTGARHPVPEIMRLIDGSMHEVIDAERAEAMKATLHKPSPFFEWADSFWGKS